MSGKTQAEVVKMLEWFIANDPNGVSYAGRMEVLEAVKAGTLIHPQDERWSWEAAFPVVTKFEVDGWEFVVREHDDLFMVPSNGPADWISAKLIDFTRGQSDNTRVGKCMECHCPIEAGTVPLYTPSGRQFLVSYRDDCGCPQGGPDADKVSGPQVRLGEAAELLVSYLAELSTDNAALKGAILDCIAKKRGSMTSLKKVGRAQKEIEFRFK